MTTTTPDTLRILDLTPEHYDSAECLLCGQYGENVDWYATWSPEQYRTLGRVWSALESTLSGLDPLATEAAASAITDAVDPLAGEYGNDFDAVCTDCASADSAALRRRIRAHADQLDEAGYSALYGPDSDDLLDSTLRDRGLWVRRHVGYELAVVDGPDGPDAA
jgi:hypothetical protein